MKYISKRNKFSFENLKVNSGLKSALEKSRPDVISIIRESGLRGRGGAGFPAGVKWNLAAAVISDEKFVICNADEGEPGTFKDRVLLTDYAELVIEGMTIGGYTIGAKKGFIYLRGEYTYLYNHLIDTLDKRRKEKILGDKIMGKDFSFDVDIRHGAGAYICGEETALIESLEGHRGEPRNRPPFPVDTGFHSKPSIVNNVETLLWATCIMSKGADWFKSIGTDKSTGPKLFSVSGDCDNPGVYEFPLGITVQKLLNEVGGENAKAVQIGGASGHTLSPSEFNRKIAFEDISTGGSVIVFGQGRDMLEVAKNFLEFFSEESCGQCTPCRAGNKKLLDGVDMLLEGRCSAAYLRELISLGATMQIACKCGLGQSSPNAFLSIIKNFKNEIMGRVGTRI